MIYISYSKSKFPVLLTWDVPVQYYLSDGLKSFDTPRL